MPTVNKPSRQIMHSSHWIPDLNTSLLYIFLVFGFYFSLHRLLLKAFESKKSVFDKLVSDWNFLIHPMHLLEPSWLRLGFEW